MSETLLLLGQLTVSPVRSCSEDSDRTVIALHEEMTLAAKQSLTFLLTGDAAFPVSLTMTPNVNMVFIDVSSKVILTITTADGASQLIPVDPTMLWISKTVPITALSVTRLAGIETTVRLLLGDVV